MNNKIMTMFAAAVAMFAGAVYGAGVNRAVFADSLVNVASGAVNRSLDTRRGHILGHSYRKGGVEFMRKGSPEFAFRIDGVMHDGNSIWKDVKTASSESKDGSRTVTVNEDGFEAVIEERCGGELYEIVRK